MKDEQENILDAGEILSFSESRYKIPLLSLHKDNEMLFGTSLEKPRYG